MNQVLKRRPDNMCYKPDPDKREVHIGKLYRQCRSKFLERSPSAGISDVLHAGCYLAPRIPAPISPMEDLTNINACERH